MSRPKLLDLFCCQGGASAGYVAAGFVMGMPWASRDGLREAIPAAYTEHIGRQLLAHLESEAAA